MSIAGKTVLIVDDATDSRMIARNILEGAGMNTTEATQVNDATHYLETQTPHLILLDLHMIGVSSFDFLAKRKQQSRIASIPVIVVSAASDRDSVYRAIALGAS